MEVGVEIFGRGRTLGQRFADVAVEETIRSEGGSWHHAPLVDLLRDYPFARGICQGVHVPPEGWIRYAVAIEGKVRTHLGGVESPGFRR